MQTLQFFVFLVVTNNYLEKITKLYTTIGSKYFGDHNILDEMVFVFNFHYRASQFFDYFTNSMKYDMTNFRMGHYPRSPRYSDSRWRLQPTTEYNFGKTLKDKAQRITGFHGIDSKRRSWSSRSQGIHKQIIVVNRQHPVDWNTRVNEFPLTYAIQFFIYINKHYSHPREGEILCNTYVYRSLLLK